MMTTSDRCTILFTKSGRLILQIDSNKLPKFDIEGQRLLDMGMQHKDTCVAIDVAPHSVKTYLFEDSDDAEEFVEIVNEQK